VQRCIMQLACRHLTLMLAPAFLMYAQLATAAEPALTVTSSPRTLYSAVQSGCGPNLIPGSPARAFRRADGNIEPIAAHFEDWMMLGKNFSSLKVSCQSILDPDDHARKVPGRSIPRAARTNFETLDHHTAIPLFTVHHLLHGTGTMNRDLAYVPLSVH